LKEKTKICTVITIEENQLIKRWTEKYRIKKKRTRKKSIKEIIKMHILNKRKKNSFTAKRK